MPLVGKDKRNLVMAYITVFMDILNFAIVVPILPFLVIDLKATSIEIGFLFSSYSVAQFFSLLAMGYLSDKYGRKPFLLLSLLGSFLGSIMQGVSKSMIELIVWRTITGFFSGSVIIVQTLIADLTVAEERNSYLARLDAVNSAAWIIGPAFGGIFARVNNFFPLIVAGAISGVALLFAIFFLKESNKTVIEISEIKIKIRKGTEEEKIAAREKLIAVTASQKKTKDSVVIKISGLMALCLLFEFCNKWVLNAVNSRFGVYLNEEFGMSSTVWSTNLMLMSAWCCIQQGVLYPSFVNKLNWPIPHLAFAGALIEILSFFLMAYVNNMWLSLAASWLLWFGYGMAAPATVSIISTTNAPEVQGRVLSWNNMFGQVSLFLCPLVISKVYEVSHKGTYYSSMIPGAIGALLMIFIMVMPNSKVFGKKSLFEMKVDTKDIEMVCVEQKKDEESVDDTIPSTIYSVKECIQPNVGTTV